MPTLNDLQPGESAVVRKVLRGYELAERGRRRQGNPGRLRLRMLELGLTPGTRVTLVQRAPMGDPLEVELRGYRLTLRRYEASAVVLEGAAALEGVDGAGGVNGRAEGARDG